MEKEYHNNFETYVDLNQICYTSSTPHPQHAYDENLEIHYPRWPPAATLKFTKKNWMTRSIELGDPENMEFDVGISQIAQSIA